MLTIFSTLYPANIASLLLIQTTGQSWTLYCKSSKLLESAKYILTTLQLFAIEVPSHFQSFLPSQRPLGLSLYRYHAFTTLGLTEKRTGQGIAACIATLQHFYGA